MRPTSHAIENGADRADGLRRFPPLRGRFWFWLLGFLGGCTQSQQAALDALPHGCIIFLPGIEGTGWELQSTVAGLRDAGLDHAVEIILWGTRPLGSIKNLVDLSANRAEAEEIADRIVELRRTNPRAPITLVAYSGGAGVALLAVEALPDDVQVDRLVLVAAAVSPTYDLSRAHRHCRDGIVSIYSEKDWFILGVGTSLLGTIDRAFTPAAGKVGFQNGDGSLRIEIGLTQIAWCDEWVSLGHEGGHLGCYSRPWARKILARHVARFAPGREVEHR